MSRFAAALRIPRYHLPGLLILVVAALYTLVVATHFTFHFEPLRAMDHYRFQAHGLAFGHLELFDSTGNPLPPELDTCNYKGKAYIGYGLLPAVAQLILEHGLGLKTTSAAIVWTICLLTLIVLYRTAYDLGRHVLAMTELRASLAAGMLCAGVAGTRQFLHEVVIPYSWSQAGAAGQLFTMLAVWMVLRFHITGLARFAALAGLSVGCATFCKANFAFVTIPLFVFLVLDRGEGAWIARTRRIVFIYGLPLAAVAASIAIVNSERFGNPFEIGFRFANASELNPATWSLPQLHRIPYNFYNHFLAPFRFSYGDFPLMEGLSQRFGGINFADGSGGLLHNVPLFSAFIALPLLLLIPLDGVRIAAIWIRRRQMDAADRWWCLFVGVAFCAFVLYLGHDSSWLRYQYDFLFAAALAVLITLVKLSRYPRFGLAAAIVLAGAGTLWQSAVGLDGALGVLFTRTQPFMYWYKTAWRPSDDRIGARFQMMRAALFGNDQPERVFFETEASDPPANHFSPGAVWHVKRPDLWFRSDGFEWIHIAGKWQGVGATVTFPAEPRAAAEPLYALGKDHITADSIRVRYGTPSPGRLPVTFFASHAGLNKPCESAEVTVVPGRAYRMEFVFDPAARQVAAMLDGAEVLYCRMEFFERSVSTAVFGRDPDKHAVFSGSIDTAVKP